MLEWDFRTLPAAAFLPLGGQLTGNNNFQASGSALGFAADLLNVRVSSKARLTPVNLSTYFLGVGYSDLVKAPDKPATWVNYVYVRGGPHFRLGGFLTESMALGFQLGYAAILKPGNNWNTEVVHGLDFGITITWFGTTADANDHCDNPGIGGTC